MEEVQERKKMEGEAVIFTDRNGKDHIALVTRDWGHVAAPRSSTSLNLVYVNDSPEMTDSYGQQILRDTSVQHQSTQTAPGYKWRDLDEEAK